MSKAKIAAKYAQNYWLRSPGKFSGTASSVEMDGTVDLNVARVVDGDEYGGGVRPVITMDLSKCNLWTYAGTVGSDGTIIGDTKPTDDPSIIYKDTLLTPNVPDAPYAGIYEYDNLTLGTGVRLTSSGVSQVIIRVKGTLTIKEGAEIRVRNGYYAEAPQKTFAGLFSYTLNKYAVNYKDYFLFPGLYGRGGTGGKGGNGTAGYTYHDNGTSPHGDGGGGGDGGYGGGSGGAGGISPASAKNGQNGSNNGGYTYIRGGGATGIGKDGNDGLYESNRGEGGGGNGGNGGNGKIGKTTGNIKHGNGGSGGGAGGYGGGVLTIIADKIVVESSKPCFLVLGQQGGKGGTASVPGQDGGAGGAGMLCVYSSSYNYNSAHWTKNSFDHSERKGFQGGHGIVTGTPQVVLINGARYGTEEIPTKSQYDITVTPEQPKVNIAAPANVKVKRASYNALTITWSKVNNASKYEVYRSTSSNGTYKKIASVIGTSYNNSSVTCGQTYYYKLKAVHASGTASDYSKAASGKTTPDSIAKLSAKRKSYDAIQLTWAKANGAEKYNVYQSSSKDKGYKKVTTTSKTYDTSKKLACNQTYYYKVEAVAKSGVKGALSGYKSATPTLDRPGSFSAKAFSRKKIKIQWKKVSGAKGFEIQIATSSKFKSATKVTKSASTTSYTKGSLKSKKTYYVRMRAYRMVNKKKVYSSYTSVKKVKVK